MYSKSFHDSLKISNSEIKYRSHLEFDIFCIRKKRSQHNNTSLDFSFFFFKSILEKSKLQKLAPKKN